MIGGGSFGAGTDVLVAKVLVVVAAAMAAAEVVEVVGAWMCTVFGGSPHEWTWSSRRGGQWLELWLQPWSCYSTSLTDAQFV